MRKDTVEFRRYPKSPQSYALLHPPTERDYLDFLVEWSKLVPDAKIYRHEVEVRYENHEAYEGQFYTAFPNTASEVKIPLCDMVYYITIYHQ